MPSTTVPKPKKAKKNAVASSSTKKVSASPTPNLAVAPSAGPDSPFTYRTTQMRLSVPPRFTGDLRAGVEEMLDSMVMRFIPKLSGVLLAHSSLTFLADAGNILYDCPFAVVDVEFGALVWAPKVGQVLSGTHSLSSPSHLSLLIHQTFNVSIPLNHIPPAIYTFDRTLSSREAEEAEVEDAMGALEEDGDEEGEGGKRKEGKSEGRWKNAVTGRAVGAEGAAVEFTVVGLTITSSILSLTGSLLADPFNPPPPGPSQSSNYPSYNSDDDDELADPYAEAADDDAHSLVAPRNHAVVPTTNTAAVSHAQRKTLAARPPTVKPTKSAVQEPAQKARKRAVSLEFSSDDDSDEGDARPVAPVKPTKVPVTADDIDTSFPLLNGRAKEEAKEEAEEDGPARKKKKKEKKDKGKKGK